MSYEFDKHLYAADGKLGFSGKLLASYGPRRFENGTQDKYVEPCTPEEATFWGVYTHNDDGLASIVGDARDAESADLFAKQVARGLELEYRLREVSVGLDAIEASLAKATKADPNDVPAPFSGQSADLWHLAQQQAYLHTLEITNAFSLKKYLEANISSKPTQAEPTLVIDLERESYRQIMDEALKAAWLPQEYTANDIHADIIQLLREQYVPNGLDVRGDAPARVVLILDGGNIQNIVADSDVDVSFVDYDRADEYDDNVREAVVDVPQESGQVCKAVVGGFKVEVNPAEAISLAGLRPNTKEKQHLIVLSIDTNYASFEDLGHAYEVARILRSAAFVVEIDGDLDCPLHDTNGNNVARFYATDVAPDADAPGMVHLVVNAPDDMAFGRSDNERAGLARSFRFLADQLDGVKDLSKRFTAFTVETKDVEGNITGVKVGHFHYTPALEKDAQLVPRDTTGLEM